MKYKCFIGIDVSKNWLDIACLYYNSPEDIVTTRLYKSPDIFTDLIKWIRNKHKVKRECLICFEETGGYSYKLWEFLSSKKWDFVKERGLEIKKSAGIRRGKSDKRDAEMIARYIFLRSNYLNLTNPPVEILKSLMTLLRFRDRLIKSALRFGNAANELIENYNRKIYGSVPKESKSIAREMTKKSMDVEHRILALIHRNADLSRLYNLIRSVPGMGLYTSAYMLVYTKAFSTHLDYRKFSCYCGIAPFEYSSGTSTKGKGRISSLGNQRMKTLLGRGAIAIATGKNNHSEFSDYYQRKKAEGKPSLVILNVIKNKMISRVYAAVKRGTPYIKKSPD